MTWIFGTRRALVATAVAIATASSLLLPAVRAAAVPAVDGYVDAYGYYRDLAGTCDIAESNEGEAHRVFTGATGRRTASTDTRYQATPIGDSTVSVDGRVANDTIGAAFADRGAFDFVHFGADHVVRLTNHTAAACGMVLVADSQAGATLHVKRRGRVLLEWGRWGAGNIVQIYVARVGGRVIVDRSPTRRHWVGGLFFRVRPGDYTIAVRFQTRVSERDVPVGATLRRRTEFGVAATFIRR